MIECIRFAPNTLEPQIPDNAYYWEGDEKASLTGGWIEGFNTGVAELIREKQPQRLYIKATRKDTGATSAGGSYEISTKVDLTNISTIKIDWENTGNTADARSFIEVGGNSGDTSYDVRIFELDTFLRKIQSLDVSVLSGVKIIKIRAGTSANTVLDTYSELKIYKVWGEV